MDQTPIRTVEMVRAIRDSIYEETKQLSHEDLEDFIARESRKISGMKKAGPSGQSAA